MFSTHSDELTDISNVFQIIIFVQWTATESIKETILFCIPLQTTAREADISLKLFPKM